VEPNLTVIAIEGCSDGSVRLARVGAVAGRDVGCLPTRDHYEGHAAMSALDIVGLALALGLLVYLVVALLYPERFE
jgi:K+-transporting ATPase KdpF subunit